MKAFTWCLIAVLWATVPFAAARPQVERLLETNKCQGDRFVEALYWLPETGEIFRRHIADHKDWVGFESGRWRLIPETAKSALFREIGEAFDKLESAQLERSWKRLSDWQTISSQLALFVTAVDSEEAFFDLADQDASLKSAFDWILARRPADFEARFIGGTFASGELPSFKAHLTEHLLNTSDTKRYECYSRLYGRIATLKAAKGDEAGAAADESQAPTKSNAQK